MLSVLAANGVFRALFDTRTPLVVTTTGALINVPISTILIFPCGLGIAGAGAGTAISQFIMAGWLGMVIVKKLHLEGVSARPSFKLILHSGLHGMPLVFRSLFLQAAIVVTTWQAAAFGAVTLAGYQILKTIWTLGAFGLDALAIAAQSLLARALGEGDPLQIRILIKDFLVQILTCDVNIVFGGPRHGNINVHFAAGRLGSVGKHQLVFFGFG